MLSCDTSYGTLQLQRYPASRDASLQAFDAADLYLLQPFRKNPRATSRC